MRLWGRYIEGIKNLHLGYQYLEFKFGIKIRNQGINIKIRYLGMNIEISIKIRDVEFSITIRDLGINIPE